MNHKIYEEIILSEILKAGQIDYQFLEQNLGLAAITVIQLTEKLRDKHVIVLEDGVFSLCSNDVDETYLSDLYNIAHKPTTNQKEHIFEQFSRAVSEIYIPKNFHN